MATKRKVLITGATGRIGHTLVNNLAANYDLVLTDIQPPRPEDNWQHPFIQADVSDYDAFRPAFEGVDTVIHLAADPSMQATWESLLPRNVIGGYNAFQAAHEAGCRRMIFASSVNAAFGYPKEIQVKTSMPVRPPNIYGATKAWGEALARVYADQLGMSCICLRFGWVIEHDSPFLTPDAEYLDLTLTYRDLVKLVAASLAAPDSLRFGIFHGVSDNRWKRFDISDAREILGYHPEDDGYILAGLYNEKREGTTW